MIPRNLPPPPPASPRRTRPAGQGALSQTITSSNPTTWGDALGIAALGVITLGLFMYTTGPVRRYQDEQTRRIGL